jgi:hypothetical protein
MAGRALVVAVAALALASSASCGGSGGESGGDTTAAATEVVGVITEISRTGGTVDAITIRSEDEETHRLELDPAIDYGFDLEHLEEHRREGLPVRCHVAHRGDAAVATVILDA